MGLNEAYEHARHHILMMDPLPSINKAFSMVLNLESEINIHGSMLGAMF